MFNVMLRFFTTAFWQFSISGSSSASRSGNNGLEWFVSWDVARLEIFVLFDSVLVKQDGASTKVGHKKLGRDNLNVKEIPPILAKQQCATVQQCDSRSHQGFQLKMLMRVCSNNRPPVALSKVTCG